MFNVCYFAWLFCLFVFHIVIFLLILLIQPQPYKLYPSSENNITRF